MSYVHSILITSSIDNMYPSYYDANTNHHIITGLSFILKTVDVATTNYINTYYHISLPAPTGNIIPFEQVTERIAKDWLDAQVNIVNLQNENIRQLQSRQ